MHSSVYIQTTVYRDDVESYKKRDEETIDSSGKRSTTVYRDDVEKSALIIQHVLSQCYTIKVRQPSVEMS